VNNKSVWSIGGEKKTTTDNAQGTRRSKLIAHKTDRKKKKGTKKRKKE
jgi:hypothetical protein